MAPSNPQLCVRGRAHPPAIHPSAGLSGCLRGCNRVPLPSLGAAHRGRAFAACPARAPRPQPPDGFAGARPAPAGAREPPGQRRSGRPAARLCCPSSSLRSEEAAPPSRGEPLSRMKKLQGAHLRKVGQEGGGAAEGGWQKPAPIKSSLRWGRSGKRPGGNTQGMLRGSRQ